MSGYGAVECAYSAVAAADAASVSYATVCASEDVGE